MKISFFLKFPLISYEKILRNVSYVNTHTRYICVLYVYLMCIMWVFYVIFRMLIVY